MVNKIVLLALFILSACGKDVTISTQKLEYNSSLTTANATTQEGLLLRDNKDRIVMGGTTYNVSIYSSYLALEYIAAKPLNTQHQIKFRGKIKGNDIVLEIIEGK